MQLPDYRYYRIVIVGTGGTGSNLVSFLSQLIGNNKLLSEKCEIVLIDLDSIEPKNLKQQKFLSEDIGKNKAEVLFDRYSCIYPNLKIAYVNEFITSKEQLTNYLLGDNDTRYRAQNVLNILVSCVDNYKARKIFHDTFIGEGPLWHMLYIDTGNNIGNKLTGQTVVGYRQCKRKQDKTTRIYSEVQVPVVMLPPVAEYYPQILTEEDVEEEPSCGDTNDTTAQNLGANITSAALTFNILNNILCFNEIPGEYYIFDAREGFVKKVK